MTAPGWAGAIPPPKHKTRSKAPATCMLRCKKQVSRLLTWLLAIPMVAWLYALSLTCSQMRWLAWY